MLAQHCPVGGPHNEPPARISLDQDAEGVVGLERQQYCVMGSAIDPKLVQNLHCGDVVIRIAHQQRPVFIRQGGLKILTRETLELKGLNPAHRDYLGIVYNTLIYIYNSLKSGLKILLKISRFLSPRGTEIMRNLSDFGVGYSRA